MKLWLLWLLVPLLASCAGLPPRPETGAPALAPPLRSVAHEATPVSRQDAKPAAPPLAALDAPKAQAEPCPDGMVLLHRRQGPYCIDRFEAALERVDAAGRVSRHPFNQLVDGIENEVRAVSLAGVRPQGYISGAQAAIACANAGKRLCEIDEWVLACRGPKLTRYPYGDQRRPNLCNDRFRELDHHPVASLWKKDPLDATNPKLMWQSRFMNDSRLLELPNTTTPTGAFAQCTNEYGVYDMVGNQHEWVNEREGTFAGGFFMDTFRNGEGCDYRTTGHSFDYHDYSTGFRCCAEPTDSR